MDFSDFIEPELYIIVPVLYVVGMIIKKSNIKDNYIPIILGLFGIFLVTVYELAYHLPCESSNIPSLIFASITQGILCASASVYANNIVKQLKENKEDEKDNNQNDGDN